MVRMKSPDTKSWTLNHEIFHDLETAIVEARNLLKRTTVSEIRIFPIIVGEEPLVEISGPIEPSKE